MQWLKIWNSLEKKRISHEHLQVKEDQVSLWLENDQLIRHRERAR
jgi:hypothetical protein